MELENKTRTGVLAFVIYKSIGEARANGLKINQTTNLVEIER